MADSIRHEITSWRRALHQIPELGLDLPKTSQYICDELTSLGIPYTRLLDGNAVVGVINGGSSGRCVGLRADMDGLPVVEETGLPFASTNGNMHACGHDGHMSMLLGAAKMLQRDRQTLAGSVKLLFQPAEESPGGAKPMLDEGAFENPRVDAVFGVHAGQLAEELAGGTLAFKPGPMMAAPDIVRIVIEGKGTHAAYPHNGDDVVVIASQLILALQTLISRRKDPVDPAVISISSIHAGTAHNVLPSTVELLGTVRTFSHELRQFYHDEVKKLCAGFETMYGVTITLDYQFVYPPLINDPAMTQFAIDTAKTVFDDDNVVVLDRPSMGAEDFAFFTEAVPGAFAFLVNPMPVDGVCYPHHSPKFDIDEAHLLNGARYLAEVAKQFLNNA